MVDTSFLFEGNEENEIPVFRSCNYELGVRPRVYLTFKY